MFLDLAHMAERSAKGVVLMSGDRDLRALAGETALMIETPEGYRVRVGE